MKIGFIGLGNMGSGMVKSLLAHSFEVIGFDIEKDRLSELENQGMEKAENTTEVAKTCELVILCLPNPDASREVIFEQLVVDGSRVKTIIETSTLTPEIVLEFADKVSGAGGQFLSSPMVGGKNHSSEGTIEFLVEGSNDVFQENERVFEAMGSKVSYMGDMPSATLAKLAFNFSRYANLAVGVETHRLLKKYGANIPAVYEFMSEQSLDNFGQVWREDLNEMMLQGVPFKPSKVPKKDLALLVDMAKSQNLDENLIEAVRKAYLSMEKD